MPDKAPNDLGSSQALQLGPALLLARIKVQQRHALTRQSLPSAHGGDAVGGTTENPGHHPRRLAILQGKQAADFTEQRLQGQRMFADGYLAKFVLHDPLAW